jgi:hypothetical protein
MTFYLWFMLVCALGGCWAIWKVQEERLRRCQEDLAGSKDLCARFMTATAMCHTALHGPLDTPTEKTTECFNSLWALAGLEEKGFL